jgi:hypothetical protein
MEDPLNNPILAPVPNQKKDRGFNHLRIGELLCPVRYLAVYLQDRDKYVTFSTSHCLIPFRFVQALKSGSIKILHSDYPSFMFQGLEKQVYDREDLFKDLCRGMILRRVCPSLSLNVTDFSSRQFIKHIFFGNGSEWEMIEQKRRPPIAEINNMTEVCLIHFPRPLCHLFADNWSCNRVRCSSGMISVSYFGDSLDVSGRHGLHFRTRRRGARNTSFSIFHRFTILSLGSLRMIQRMSGQSKPSSIGMGKCLIYSGSLLSCLPPVFSLLPRRVTTLFRPMSFFSILPKILIWLLCMINAVVALSDVKKGLLPPPWFLPVLMVLHRDICVSRFRASFAFTLTGNLDFPLQVSFAAVMICSLLLYVVSLDIC